MMIALHHFLSCPCESKRLHFQAEFLQFLVLLLQPSTRIWHIGQNAKGNLSWSSILSWLDRKSTWNQELLWRCSCHDGWFWIGNCILDHRKCCERENYWNKIKPIRFHWRQSNRIFRGKSCGTWAYSTNVNARKRSNYFLFPSFSSNQRFCKVLKCFHNFPHLSLLQHFSGK